MAKIKSVRAREILDSRGFPTVEVEVGLDDGSLGRAAVPSGASTGEHEAVELRDGDKNRYAGKGVLIAAANAERVLGKAVAGMDASAQEAVDQTLIGADGSPNKGKLGANAVLGVSMAVSRAAAASAKTPLYKHLRSVFAIPSKEWLLPAPMLNIVNGGKHADSGLNIQELMIVPTGPASFSEALRAGAEVYHVLKSLLAAKGHTTSVGDEGGFAPHLKTHDEAIRFILDAVKKAGYEGKVQLAVDAAASEFCSDGVYGFEGGKLSAAQLQARYAEWVEKYPVLSIEDPLAEDDWAGWKSLTSALGPRIRVVGDDLFVTNPERLARGIREGSANSILIKLNQIGTVTETVRAIRMAHEAGFSAIVSHRSGETEDPYIADLAVATNAGAIKTGAPCRSERLAKYNQLLRIEAELAGQAVYAGDRSFRLKKVAAGAR
ncbi:MAG TPA: phosphopyruvate hydratase [Elusimicrobiota bacterium]|jgi:enolase|nr:phosphopyruvate hydratase [Elusimicrobiota bacterium]